ncbi:hypothetical protein V498_10133, partial [Pseudogymnoascus sp. VKM F-4517 (FW-2822)]
MALDDESGPLLASASDAESGRVDDSTGDESRDSKVPTRVTNRLYISHFLSTWNSRVFEFGAALYLASIFPGTLVSVERDWVVVVCKEDEAALRDVNAQMRRIDLTCKLIGPLFISLVDGMSTEVAILVNLGMNMASVAVEYFAIAQVYYEVPELQQPKTKLRDEPLTRTERRSRSVHSWRHVVRKVIQKSVLDFSLYFHHPA